MVKEFDDINKLEFGQVYLFHTLKDVFAYARSEGFREYPISRGRKHIFELRKKYKFQSEFLNNLHGCILHEHSRKDWFERKECDYSTKIFIVRRQKGDWLVRVINCPKGNKAYVWVGVKHEWFFKYGDPATREPIIVPDSRAEKRAKKEYDDGLPYTHPEYLEVTGGNDHGNNESG